MKQMTAPKAELRYVVPPTDEQLSRIRDFLRKKYNADELELVLQEDKNLLGGFVIRIGNEEYDWSMRGRLQQMQQGLKEHTQRIEESGEIITILKTEIEESAFDTDKIGRAHV